jgi:EmrB/QacA subfamily drug resistance transporter
MPTQAKSTHRPLTVVAVLLSMFMAAMEATVVATAMPTVVEKLGGIEYYGWVGAVYLLTSTVTMPLYGKLADIFGRKPIMLLGLAIFLIGSTGSGLAATMTELIAARAVQGIGAGGLQTVALTIVGDLFTPEERARIQGVFGAVWGIAGMSGPLLGGLIVKALSWRWVFFVNIPFGVLSGIVLVSFFHETIDKRDAGGLRRLDALGTLTLGGGIVSLLLGAGRFMPLVTLPLSVVLLVGFVAVERRAREPLISLELLRRPIIAVSSIAGALFGAVMSASVIYLPLFVQAVMSGSPTEAGGAVAPMLVGWPIASALSGRLLARLGPRPLVRSGFAIVATASIGLSLLLGANAGLFAIGATMFVMGCGMGLANTALVIAVQENASWKERGVATASTMFFRTIGGAIAVGALGALLAAKLGDDVPTDLLNALLGPDHGRSLAPEKMMLLAIRLGGALHLVFQVIAATSIGCLIAGLFFPKGKIAKRSEIVTPEPLEGA